MFHLTKLLAVLDRCPARDHHHTSLTTAVTVSESANVPHIEGNRLDALQNGLALSLACSIHLFIPCKKALCGLCAFARQAFGSFELKGHRTVGWRRCDAAKHCHKKRAKLGPHTVAWGPRMSLRQGRMRAMAIEHQATRHTRAPFRKLDSAVN